MSAGKARWTPGGHRSASRAPRRLRPLLASAVAACAAGAWLGAAQLHATPLSPEPFAPAGPKIQPAEEAGTGYFGRSVSLSADGGLALIGAPRESAQAGSAWVFAHAGATWSEQARLSVPASEASNFFGRSVSISADGSTALVGDPGNSAKAGAAWVFVRSGSTWTRQARLVGAGESGPGQFGRSVALSADGSVALVGAFNDSEGLGGAWVFRRSGSTWTQDGPELTGASAGETGHGFFGRSVALSGDGATALITANLDSRGVGAAWVFVREASGWKQQGAKLLGGEEAGDGEFGSGAALSGDGRTALVGGAKDEGGIGAAWVFTRSGTSWSQQGSKLTGSGEVGSGSFGFSAALSGDGSTALVGAPGDSGDVGAAWAFIRREGSWSQLGGKLTGAEEFGPGFFGYGVGLTGDGLLALVGGIGDENHAGAAWPFARKGEEPPVEEPPTGTTTTPPPSTTTSTTTTTAPIIHVLGNKTVSAPVFGVSGNVAPVSGVVRLRLPGTSVFVPLSSLEQIPFGTVIDASAGRVQVTAAGQGGTTQSGEFFGGQFQLTQAHNGVVTALLTGGKTLNCRTHREHSKPARRTRDSDLDRDGDRVSAFAAARRHGRRLWANAHGTFTTKGSYAAGAVQGTEWLTEDRCDGTYIRVTRDKVKVTDLVRHRTHIVRAGHSIIIRPRER